MSKKKAIRIGVLIFAVAAVVGLFLPVFVRAPVTSGPTTCIHELRQIDAAKKRWALANGGATNDAPTWADILPHIRNGEKPECPAGGTYILGRAYEPPRCTSMDGQPGHHSL